jgi:arginine decarboxylase
MVGIRIRLNSKGAGKWADSSGDTAKFGLSAAEALEAWEVLQESGFGNSLKMIHFHIGSQVPDIMHFKQAAREAARYYAKFLQLGAKIEYIDVGGGLAIDYDGSGTTFHSSMNYSLDEYASTVIYNVRDVCDEEKAASDDCFRIGKIHSRAPHGARRRSLRERGEEPGI